MKYLPPLLELAGASALITAGFLVAPALGLALTGCALLAGALYLERRP